MPAEASPATRSSSCCSPRPSSSCCSGPTPPPSWAWPPTRTLKLSVHRHAHWQAVPFDWGFRLLFSGGRGEAVDGQRQAVGKQGTGSGRQCPCLQHSPAPRRPNRHGVCETTDRRLQHQRDVATQSDLPTSHLFGAASARQPTEVAAAPPTVWETATLERQHKEGRHTAKCGVFSRKGSGNTRQRHCLDCHDGSGSLRPRCRLSCEGSGDTGQRRCLSREHSGSGSIQGKGSYGIQIRGVCVYVCVCVCVCV